MAHDFEAQRAETFETFDLLEAGETLPAEAVVEYLFYAEDMEPDWKAAEKALVAKGFRVKRDEAEGVLEASIGPIKVTPEEVWKWEKAATEVLVGLEFWPDGWGMAVEE